MVPSGYTCGSDIGNLVSQRKIHLLLLIISTFSKCAHFQSAFFCPARTQRRRGKCLHYAFVAVSGTLRWGLRWRWIDLFQSCLGAGEPFISVISMSLAPGHFPWCDRRPDAPSLPKGKQLPATLGGARMPPWKLSAYLGVCLLVVSCL